MKTYFTIDSGNTHFKVAQFNEAGELLKSKKLLSLDELKLAPDDEAIFCSVNIELPDLASQNNVNFKILKELRESIGFNTRYAKTLGEDRLAICFYLQKVYPNKKVTLVDAGTFLTIDFIENGEHLGGYIYPGLGTFSKSYNLQGKNLPEISFKERESSLPTTTFDAINNSVNNYLEHLKEFISTQESDLIFITGGEMDIVKSGQKKEVLDKDLLHKSLFYILTLK